MNQFMLVQENWTIRKHREQRRPDVAVCRSVATGVWTLPRQGFPFIRLFGREGAPTYRTIIVIH